MPSYSTATTIQEFHINKLTKAEYTAAVINGEITTPDISIITDDSGCIEAVTTMPTFMVTKIYGNTTGDGFVLVNIDTVNNVVVWDHGSVSYYTSGTTEPESGDNIYSDIDCLETYDTVDTVDSLVGTLYHYIGTTTNDFTYGYFYKSVIVSGDYGWEQINVQPGSHSASATLLSGNANWVMDSGLGLVCQTVTVSGVTANNNVWVSPAPSSTSDWTAAGIICQSQGTNSLTFSCTTIPSTDITVNIIIM